MAALKLLCAGAAQGLVKTIEARWPAAGIDARFGAVGALREALEGGAVCDVIVVTDAMIVSLAEAGRVDGRTRAPLGSVRTGIAVRSGQARPDVSTPEALAEALRAADAIYSPDAERSTAGTHFAGVLRSLGLTSELTPRLATYPNGATAMRELAASRAANPIGCTQVTEIRYTPGVALVGLLPRAFELATVYSAAVATGAADRALAQRFIEVLAGEAARELRAEAGFEPL
jgi:molybdate transport system substrate-binding protein